MAAEAPKSTSAQMESGVSCSALACAALIPCAIFMDGRGMMDETKDENDNVLSQILDGVGGMTQYGDACKQASVQYRWSIECFSEQYVGDSFTTTNRYKKLYTHKAFQIGMLRCLDASQPLQPGATDKSFITLRTKVDVQIDPAFRAEYERKREE